MVVFEHPAYQGTLKNVIVQVSNNGEDWTLWREKGAWPPTTSIVGEKGSWRYLRIELECPNGKGNNIDEISLFCDESAVETEDPTQRPSVDPDWIKPKPSYLPSAAQKRQRNLKYGMFIHYGLSTFLDTEHSEKTHGTEMAESYRPSDKLDPESWVKAAYEAGMDYVLLVTKHTDGFVMWDSDYAEYGINHTGRDGEMDIVKAVSEACQKYGIKLALYYCLYDGHWEDNYTTESTGLDTQALYNKQNEVMINQLTELMDGRYGEIVELWMDAVWYKPDEAWELERIYDTVKKLQPSCQISVNHTMGKGKAPKNHKYGDPIHYFPSDFRLLDPHFTNPGPDADPKIFSHGDNMYYLPFEATITMNKAWFWKTNENASGTRTPEYVKEKYQHMVEQNNNLVINLGPNRDGLLAEYDVEALHNAARYMGFARGNARLTAADERKVEVRHETTDGKVAFTTQELYGKEGESYSTSPVENHAAMGYRLTVAPDNAKGAFGSTKTVVTYVYEDMLNSMRAIYFSGGESAEGDAPLQDETATGDTIILPENPFNKEGYTFIGWNDGSKTWRPGVAYTVPDHDVSFTAEWEVPGAVFELKVVNGSGSGQYRAGEEVTVTAEEAPAGKRFIGWKASREIEGADLTQNPCVFTMPEFAVELTAEYDEWVDVDTGKLEELLNTCKNLKTDDYTEASFSGMAAAIKDAEAVLEKGSVTQEDIDRVYHALKDIYDNLEKKAALFELKVTNGSGSGEYRAGDEVTVTADTAPEGKLFKGWTASQELGDVDLTQNPLVFTMPGANVELTAEYESMPEKVYAIDKEHQNQTYKKGQKEDLTFRVDAPMEEYIGTYINGVELQKGKDVEITEGSTIVKVKRRYLEKLDAGTYTITIRFKDAYAKTNFKVKGGSAVGPNAGEELNKTPDRNSSVKTGDKTDFALWIAVMGIAVIMIGIVLYRRCKKTSKK